MRDEALQPREMGPAPVDSLTIPASPERPKPAKDAQRHEPLDILALHRGEKTITGQATGKWTEGSFQLERLDDLFNLSLGIARAQPLPSHHRLALEQTHITRQQDSSLA